MAKLLLEKNEEGKLYEFTYLNGRGVKETIVYLEEKTVKIHGNANREKVMKVYDNIIYYNDKPVGRVINYNGHKTRMKGFIIHNFGR